MKNELSLKSSMARLEDAIIVISGPALAISGIIAGVDLVTGGNALRSVSWLSLVWAITLLLTLDFQVLALGVRAHRCYASKSHVGQKVLEIVLATVVAAGISFVSIQMQSIIARVNAESVNIDQAAMQLGINTIALIWERSTLVLVLIFMSGWLRENDTVKASAIIAPAPAPQPSISDETMQIILAKLEKLDALEQRITQVIVTERAVVPELPEPASSLTGTDEATNPELPAIPPPTERIAIAYQDLVRQGSKLTVDALQLTAKVRRQTVVDWMNENNVREESTTS